MLSQKQAMKLAIVLVCGFAFLNSSGPIYSWDFIKEFILKVFLYGAAAEIIVIMFMGWIFKKEE